MPWTPRHAPLLLSITLVAVAGIAAAATAPTEIRRHPVGYDRIVRPALPQPVRLQGGAVTVPTSLREFPTVDFDSGVADDPAEVMHVGSAALRGAVPDHIASVGANVRVNNTAGDPAGSTQSETTVAAMGSYLVAGWNDGTNFGVSPGGTGYGYSTDGGLSWTDGGVLPVPTSTAVHEGDPV